MPLPRDHDGYIDLDAVEDDDVDLDLAAMAPPPPLADETWDALVAAAPHTDPDVLGLDLDALTAGSAADAEAAAMAAAEPMPFAAPAEDWQDVDAEDWDPGDEVPDDPTADE